jgi:hypothetical protein
MGHSWNCGAGWSRMIGRIISGGQTGADRAALDAALACSVPHGGWCPRGRLAEDGPIPEIYRLRETEGRSYLARTEKNVKISDGTVIFTLGALTAGSARTADFARRHRKPWLHVVVGEDVAAAAHAVNRFVETYDIRELNVAGPRESSDPMIYGKVLQVMRLLLGGA